MAIYIILHWYTLFLLAPANTRTRSYYLCMDLGSLGTDADMCFFHPQEKVGRKTPAPLFRAEIRVAKTRRREVETGLRGR